MDIIERFREAPAPEPATIVWEEIEGRRYTIVVRNDAIAHKLGRRRGVALMVEECSDFIASNRELIIAAARRRLERWRPLADEPITLKRGDF